MLLVCFSFCVLSFGLWRFGLKFIEMFIHREAWWLWCVQVFPDAIPRSNFLHLPSKMNTPPKFFSASLPLKSYRFIGKWSEPTIIFQGLLLLNFGGVFNQKNVKKKNTTEASKATAVSNPILEQYFSEKIELTPTGDGFAVWQIWVAMRNLVIQPNWCSKYQKFQVHSGNLT